VSATAIKPIDQHLILRKRTFAVSARDITLDVLGAVLVMLRSEHATGCLHIDLSQGVPSSIRFEETAKITS
jgi:hypothetical protein